MKKIFYCANCGREIDPSMGAYMFFDNFLQVKYFEDNKSNRFCSEECACESLFGKFVYIDEIPLDDDEKEIDEPEPSDEEFVDDF